MDISTAEEFELNLKRMNKPVLNILLKDMTMERNIIFATDVYASLGYKDTDEITRDRIFCYALNCTANIKFINVVIERNTNIR